MKAELTVQTKQEKDGTWSGELREVNGSRVVGCKSEEQAKSLALLGAATTLIDEREMRIRRLELRPGDLVVLEARDHLPLPVFGRIRADWERLATGTKPVILDAGMTLSAVLGTAPAVPPAPTYGKKAER